MTIREARGFTLIEAMLAMVIVSIGVLALQSFYSAVLQTQQLAQNRITAVHIGEQILEQWQARADDTLPTVDCTAGALQLTANTATTCTPTGGEKTVFTILPTTKIAKAPLPDGLGNVLWSKMIPATNSAGNTVTPTIKVVTISWNHKGETKSVVLTHLTQP